jgi:hypothetical protein
MRLQPKRIERQERSTRTRSPNGVFWAVNRPAASEPGPSICGGRACASIGAKDLPPRQIGDDEIAEIIRRTLEEMPPDATHWSLRSMASAVGHAPSTIHRLWQAFGLQPPGGLPRRAPDRTAQYEWEWP